MVDVNLLDVQVCLEPVTVCTHWFPRAGWCPSSASVEGAGSSPASAEVIAPGRSLVVDLENLSDS